MEHRVVKPFPYSEDGFTLIDLNVGDEREFGAMADGLVAEGWIVSVDEVAPAAPQIEEAIEDAPIELAIDPPTEPQLAAPPRRGRPRKS